MALALPGSMGSTAKKMGTGNRPQAMKVAMPSTAPEMGLSDHLLLLSVFTRWTFTMLSLLLQHPQCCFRAFTLKDHTHKPRCCRLLWGCTMSTSTLWITQLGCSVPRNQEHLVARPWPVHGAVSCIREEETGVGWDLCLWAIRLTGTYHTNISSSQKGFATPQPHASTFFHDFNPHNLQRHLTAPGERWHTSPHTGWWDSFLLQRPCGCHHLSRPGIHVSTLQWAPQTGLLWRRSLWHWKSATSRSPWGRGRKSSVVKGAAVHTRSESISDGLWPRACSVQPRNTLHSSGHWELWNIILRLLAIFPWVGHNTDTVTLKAQLPVASWLPKALAWGSCPKADPPWRNTACWQSWHRD